MITNIIYATRQIFDLSSHLYQLQTIAIAQDLRMFLTRILAILSLFGIFSTVKNGILTQQ